MKAILEAKNLLIGYPDKGSGTKALFANSDLQLFSGELTAIVGQNGAGKSTLIRTLSGHQKALEGEILIDGQEINHLSRNQLSKQMSIVLTDRIHDQHLTVFDVVSMGRYPFTGFWARLQAHDRKMIQQSLEMTGVSGFAKRLFMTLSDGEKQKVMIAKALAQDTPVILLDEPSAFLDYPSKIELLHLLKNLVSELGKTVLYSTHDLDLVMHTADRLWLLSTGKTVVHGIPEQLVLDGIIEKWFSRKGLRFDVETARFFAFHENKAPIGLVAEGLLGIWIKNALLRKGWNVINQHIDPKVLLQDSEIVLYDNLQTHKLASIEELLELLSNKKNQAK